METEKIFAIILAILGILQAIQTIHSIKLKNKQTLLDNSIKQNELKIQQDKLDAEKKLIEVEEKRDKKLDEKFKAQLQNTRMELKSLADGINAQGRDLSDIKISVRQLRDDFSNHKSESALISDFFEVFNYAKQIGCDGWVTDDDTEKYRALLLSWFNSIKELMLSYYDRKIRPNREIIQYDVESEMMQLIESFYKLSSGTISEVVLKETFRGYIEDKKKIHAKSEILAIDLKKNGLTYDELNKKVGKYLIDFSKKYQYITNEWLRLYRKQYEDAA